MNKTFFMASLVIFVAWVAGSFLVHVLLAGAFVWAIRRSSIAGRPRPRASRFRREPSPSAVRLRVLPYRRNKQASESLFELLKGHYGPIRQYLDATDTAGREKATKALKANAGQIAKFLSGANPNLPYDAVNGLLLAHGGHHVAQIDQLKAGKTRRKPRPGTPCAGT